MHTIAHEPCEIDETGMCYFAALIYGLRIINEKEADRGMVPGSTPLDVDALVQFVRHKGDVLVHHMSMETGKASRVSWTQEEMKAVVAAARRRFPSGDLLPWQFHQAAQAVLPPDRQKPKTSLYSISEKLRDLAGTGVTYDPAERPPYRRMIRAALNGNGSSSGMLATPATPAPTGSLVELLARQITSTLVEVQIQALELAAEQLRAASRA